MSDSGQTFPRRLNEMLDQAGQEPLGEDAARQLERFVSLFIRWNARTNLSSIRDEEGILRRHVVESIACARALPGGLSTLLDFGSGGGFPGIPVAICRPEITVTLAESQGKKAAFLREAVRTAEISALVHGGRAEALPAVFGCVTLRAVDRMEEAVSMAAPLVASAGWLALMTTGADRARMVSAAGGGFAWGHDVQLPGSEHRLLALGQRLPRLGFLPPPTP